MAEKSISVSDAKIKNLRKRISEVLLAGTNEWCVGCGAGAKAIRELLTTRPEALRELVTEEAITTGLTHVNIDDIKSFTDWCVGCGAGAKSMLRHEVLGPTTRLDEIMNEVEKILHS